MGFQKNLFIHFPFFPKGFFFPFFVWMKCQFFFFSSFIIFYSFLNILDYPVLGDIYRALLWINEEKALFNLSGFLKKRFLFFLLPQKQYLAHFLFSLILTTSGIASANSNVTPKSLNNLSDGRESTIFKVSAWASRHVFMPFAVFECLLILASLLTKHLLCSTSFYQKSNPKTLENSNKCLEKDF